MTIVRLTPQDWESHRELRLEALATNPGGVRGRLRRQRGIQRRDVARAAGGGRLWQAREGSMPRGLVGLWDPLIDAGELDGAEATPFLIALFVCPSARGRGIGAALVEAVLVEARARGHRRVLLESERDQRPGARARSTNGWVSSSPTSGCPIPVQGGAR